MIATCYFVGLLAGFYSANHTNARRLEEKNDHAVVVLVVKRDAPID